MPGRPVIAVPLNDKPHRDLLGYKIGGRQHQPGCRCRACRVVRRNGRERRVLTEFYC